MKKLPLICLVAVTGILAAEPAIRQVISPVAIPDMMPNAEARKAVDAQIVVRLMESMPTQVRPLSVSSFSRAYVPMQSLPQYAAAYSAIVVVDKQERLPFVISMSRGGNAITGYVRLSDNAIFIYRPETMDYIASTLDPRFAPKQAEKIEAQKPT